MNDLIWDKDIGKGTIGIVKLYHKPSIDKKITLIAMREIDKSKISNELNNFIVNEIKVFKELSDHKNHQVYSILNLEDYKDTIKEYLIGMEYCSGGSISKCLKKYYVMYGKPFSEEIVQYLMRQIVQGVKFIHEKGIIHRDLRNENIYVKFYDNREDYNKLNMMKTHIKIGDFGFAIRENNSHKVPPAYNDPILLKKYNERLIFKDIDTLDKSNDIWSLGALCYEMLTCQKIFRYKNISELYNYISCSNELSSFLNGMLTYDPKKRLTIEELSNHPFLTKDISQFNKIIINNNRVERTNINENSRFSTNVSKSMLSSGSMFTGWSNVDEGSRKLFYQFDNKSRQMQKLNNPQNININNINPNMQIQNKNLDHRNIPENQNVINNIPNNKNSNLSKSMFQFQSKNSLDESTTTIINNSSYMEFSTYQNDLKFQNIKNNFNQSQNPSQNSPSTSFTTNHNQKLSYNNNYQTNYYSQIGNFPNNNFNNFKHSISGSIKQNPQKPVLKNYQYSYSGPINYKA